MRTNKLLKSSLIVLLLAVLSFSFSRALAVSTYFSLTAVVRTSCTPGQPIFVSFNFGVAPGDKSSHTWTLTNQRTGAVSGPVVIGPFGPGGPTYFSFIAENTVPAGTVAGDTLIQTVVASSAIGSGTTSSLTFNCTTGQGLGYQGPPIPAGFVLRVITCDVAVFDSAGGSPVGTNRITAGQSWFVNPKPVNDAKGASWTEVFVSGVPNGFIPSKCVAGRPAGYGGN